MGKMTRGKIIGWLLRDNPRAARSDIEMYADLLLDYQAAQSNIDAHGAIVFHPKTGAPIDNPYLRVRAAATATMRKIRLDTSALWDSGGKGKK
jgi:phage terminase small subunit